MSSNGYPFVTKNEVSQRIASEPAFALECVRLVDERRGWMASHKARAAKLAAKIADGNLSPEDFAEAVALAVPYARTVSRVLREKEMAESPQLAVQAAVFGVVRPTTVQTETSAASVALAPVATASTEPVSVPRKRGRPKGSKNKPKEESTPKRRRRS